MAMGKLALYGDLLDMSARVAVRAYTHFPQTARMYYKPPSMPPPTTTAGASSSCSPSCGGDNAGSSASPCGSTKHQQEAAAAASSRVAFGASSDFILYGVERSPSA